MDTTPKPRLPFKGPIVVYALLVFGLAAAARFVERHSVVLQGVSGIESASLRVVHEEGGVPGLGALDLGGDRDLEEQLAPFMPLAGLPLPQQAGLESGAGGALAMALNGQASAGSAESEEAPRWTYLMTGDQRRAHRGAAAPHAPLEVGVRSSAIGAVGHGAPPAARPCGLEFQLLDGGGAPLEVEAVRVTQEGADGSHHLSAYRSIEGEGRWIGGSPALTPGTCALFVIEATLVNGSVWSGSTLGCAPLRGDVALGAVTLTPAGD